MLACACSVDRNRLSWALFIAHGWLARGDGATNEGVGFDTSIYCVMRAGGKGERRWLLEEESEIMLVASRHRGSKCAALRSLKSIARGRSTPESRFR